ncbi:MAG: hypothetical protein CVV07_03780 [Gammaproteobacteria bacterium HGW-Gammaproteobacteria-11]|nr:MAG: hypothetical protein CVV07_03780 [Gammaproteobacteria bacterium HGW-Gammaproteobacteria-11]
MKKIFILGFMLFLHGCAIVEVSPSVEGRVVNEDGQPVVATVVLRHNRFVEKSTAQTTDSNGYYMLKKLRVLTFTPISATRLSSTVSISAPGYKAVEFDTGSYKALVRDVQLESE